MVINVKCKACPAYFRAVDVSVAAQDQLCDACWTKSKKVELLAFETVKELPLDCTLKEQQPDGSWLDITNIPYTPQWDECSHMKHGADCPECHGVYCCHCIRHDRAGHIRRIIRDEISKNNS